jgi:hypothetical protein
MRADRLCAIPECRKPLLPAGIAHEDPFCSSTCCRRFHGTELQANPGTTRRY